MTSSSERDRARGSREPPVRADRLIVGSLSSAPFSLSQLKYRLSADVLWAIDWRA
jgi:hypothetical protein